VAQGQDTSHTIQAWVTSNLTQLSGIDPSLPVEAIMFASAQDFAGAGSTSDVKVSGIGISFSLMQQGVIVPVQGLTDPVQLTAPVEEKSDLLTKVRVRVRVRVSKSDLLTKVRVRVRVRVRA